jgi:hypothetical protein
MLVVVLATACVDIPAIDRAGAVLPTATPAPSSTPRPTDGATQPTATPPVEVTSPPTPEPSPIELSTPRPTDEPTTEPTPEATQPSATINVNDPACFDDAVELEGFSWAKPYEWYFNADSTPGKYVPDEVLAVLQRAVANVINERNDCGRPDRIFADATYLGTTSKQPCTSQGDETNVIGFGPGSPDLSEDTIAYTCPYTFSASGTIAEADVVIGEDVDWAVTLDQCRGQELLEPTITHEIGHVFGLGHVSERQHGELTMSTRSDGPCDNGSSTLGLGDMLGLEELYPKP